MKSNSSQLQLFYDIIIIVSILIWPLFGLILLLFLGPKVHNKTILFIFLYGFIGYSFLLTDTYLDSYRYAQQFFSTVNGKGVTFFQNIHQGIYDLYTILSIRLVALFTNNVHVLFALWGAVFGFFVSEAYKVISRKCKDNSPILLYITVLIVMFFINPPINVNGVRFWTALWVAFAGFLLYEVDSKKRGLIYILITPLFHTAFLLFVLVYFLYKIIKIKKYSFLIILFLLTYVLSFIMSSTVVAKYLINVVGAESHFATYLGTEYIASRNELMAKKSTLNVILTSLPRLFMCVYILFCNRRNMSYLEDKTFRFLLIFMVVFNILGLIPSVARFEILGYLIFLFYLLINSRDMSNGWALLITAIVIITFAGQIYVSNEFLPKVLNLNLLPNYL